MNTDKGEAGRKAGVCGGRGVGGAHQLGGDEVGCGLAVFGGGGGAGHGPDADEDEGQGGTR